MLLDSGGVGGNYERGVRSGRPSGAAACRGVAATRDRSLAHGPQPCPGLSVDTLLARASECVVQSPRSMGVGPRPRVAASTALSNMAGRYAVS